MTLWLRIIHYIARYGCLGVELRAWGYFWWSTYLLGAVFVCSSDGCLIRRKMWLILKNDIIRTRISPFIPFSNAQGFPKHPLFVPPLSISCTRLQSPTFVKSSAVPDLPAEIWAKLRVLKIIPGGQSFCGTH